SVRRRPEPHRSCLEVQQPLLAQRDSEEAEAGFRANLRWSDQNVPPSKWMVPFDTVAIRAVGLDAWRQLKHWKEKPCHVAAKYPSARSCLIRSSDPSIS